MGQAKRRGSFEERKAQAVARNAQEAAKRTAEHQELLRQRRAEASARQAAMANESPVVLADGPRAISHAELAHMLAILGASASPLLVVDSKKR